MHLSRERGSISPPSITFFDLETTTKEPATAEILTGYFKTVDPKTRKLIDCLHVRMKPRKWIFESFEFHGISEKLAATFPDKKDMMRLIFRYLSKHVDSLFICHANWTTFGIKGYFDWQVIKTECLYLDVLHHFRERFENIEVYSTHTIAKDRKWNVKNFKLKTLADHIGFEFTPHDCEQDVLATEAIFWELMDTRDQFSFMEDE